MKLILFSDSLGRAVSLSTVTREIVAKGGSWGCVIARQAGEPFIQNVFESHPEPAKLLFTFDEASDHAQKAIARVCAAQPEHAYVVGDRVRFNWLMKFLKCPISFVDVTEGLWQDEVCKQILGYEPESALHPLVIRGKVNVGIEVNKLVCLSPGVGLHPEDANKNWGSDNFGALAQELIKRGATVVLVGSPWNVNYGTIIKMMVPQVHNMMGLPFTDTATLIAGSKFFFGNSNGFEYVAAALEVPTLVVGRAKEFDRDQPRGKDVYLLKTDKPHTECRPVGFMRGCACVSLISMGPLLSFLTKESILE